MAVRARGAAAPARASSRPGCGTALLWRRNLERIDPTWKLTLTDSSPGMLDAARTELGDRAEYLVADLQALPFEDGSFDVVLANHMLYHVPDRPRAFAEVARVLAPGGSFHASTNGRGFMQELVELVGPRWRFAQHMEAFGLETGPPQLEPFFADVRVERFENELAVTEVEPVLAYIRSSSSFPADADLDDVARSGRGGDRARRRLPDHLAGRADQLPQTLTQA